jgi:hypothetical protein
VVAPSAVVYVLWPSRRFSRKSLRARTYLSVLKTPLSSRFWLGFAAFPSCRPRLWRKDPVAPPTCRSATACSGDEPRRKNTVAMVSIPTLALIAGEWVLRFLMSDHLFRHASHPNDWSNWPQAPLTSTEPGVFSDVPAFFTQRAIRDLLRSGESIRPSQHRFKGPLETPQQTWQAFKKHDVFVPDERKDRLTQGLYTGDSVTPLSCFDFADTTLTRRQRRPVPKTPRQNISGAASTSPKGESDYSVTVTLVIASG